MPAERRTIVAELLGLVVAEPERHAEAVAQRRRQQTGARRRADERERRQVERERARRGALAEHDVEAEVLERRVEDLLGGAVEPVDLVDEEDVARLDRGEDRGDVLLLERGAGDGAHADAELLRMICASVVLPSPGGPTSRTWSRASPRALGRVERDSELLLDPFLADEVVEPARPQRALELLVLWVQRPAARELRSRPRPLRAACARAPRRAGSGSSSASACSASTTE